MKKIFIVLNMVFVIFIFTGCNKELEVREIAKVPKDVNSLVLLSSNRFDSQLKSALQKSGFNVKPYASTNKRKVYTASGETSFNQAATRYGILHHGIKRGNGDCLITSAEAFKEYTLELVDLASNNTVVALSMGGWIGTCHSPEQDYILEEMSKKLQKLINPNKTKFNDAMKDLSSGLVVINKNDIKDSVDRVFSDKNSKVYNGKYKVLYDDIKDRYGIIVFKEGRITDFKVYTDQNRRVEAYKYVNGTAVETKLFFNSGSLRAIIPIVDKQKDGVAKYFYETGELNLEILFSKDIPLEGTIHQQNGSKAKMTEAHFYNLGFK